MQAGLRSLIDRQDRPAVQTQPHAAGLPGPTRVPYLHRGLHRWHGLVQGCKCRHG